jgi:hypothetical protein
MNPAVTRDDTMTVAAVAPAVAEALRLTWPATPDMYAQVFATVADTFQDWGVAWPVADLLGELAAYYADEVLTDRPSPYVAVTAMLTGRRATVSVIPAYDLEPPNADQLPYVEGPLLPPSWGSETLAAGPCRYAGINVISTGRTAT